ncbi:MAG TPA: DUF456 family protein [Bacillaceae bacterium]
MEFIYWSLIIILIAGAFIGLFYPIIPSVLLLAGAFLLYGVLFSFEPFNWLFWLIQGLFVVLLLSVDNLANVLGVKKFGGSKAGMWGSAIGILAGPFVIPAFGILIGPFLGAIAGEMIVNRTPFKKSVVIGLGSVAGFIGSVIAKAIIQVIMVVYFFMAVL